MDTVTADLGYLVNAGFTDIWGSNQDTDNQFAVSVLVQMSDAEVSTDNTTLSYVYFSINFGDIIVVGKHYLFLQVVIFLIAKISIQKFYLHVLCNLHFG